MHCNCDQNPCRCVATKSNQIRSDVEHRVTELLGRGDLGVVQQDGITENNIALLRELRLLHEHFIATQGAMLVHVGARAHVPDEFNCHHHGHHSHGHYDCRCEPECEEIEACPECFDPPDLSNGGSGCPDRAC